MRTVYSGSVKRSVMPPRLASFFFFFTFDSRRYCGGALAFSKMLTLLIMQLTFTDPK